MPRTAQADGVTRAVAFSQFPQWSCTTSGSSMNEMWRRIKEAGLEKQIEWSLIDRWHSHPAFINALAHRVIAGLEQFQENERSKVVMLFSAHSLPMRRVNAGDPYPAEVGATVARVMERLAELGVHNHYTLCWQSKVGPLPWLGPKTQEAMKAFFAQGMTHFMAIPVAFTTVSSAPCTRSRGWVCETLADHAVITPQPPVRSPAAMLSERDPWWQDHIETLYEIDVEFGEEAEEMGAVFKRSPSFNGDALFGEALGVIAADHLASGQVASPQYALNCPVSPAALSPAHAAPSVATGARSERGAPPQGCVSPSECRQIVNPITPYMRLKDATAAR